MSEKDIAAKNYLTDNAVFADICNFYLYDGEQVIKPENLQSIETSYAEIIGGEIGKTVVEKHRDLLKSAAVMADDTAAYMLVGIENQSKVDYAMPVRSMFYDVLEWSRQIKEKEEMHRLAGDKAPTSAEFLSGFHKGDRLIPVITIVLFLSPDEWDGPRSLHDMMDENSKKLLPFLPDYKLNIVSPREISDDDFKKFKTSTKAVLKALKYAKDKNKLKNLMTTDEAYKELSIAAANLINAYIGARLIIKKGKGTYNMSSGLKEWLEEIEAKGEAKGEARGEARGRELTLTENIRSLMNNMGISIEKAMNSLNVNPNDFAHYRALVLG